MPVVHTFNPNYYLGGWKQEDHNLRPAQTKKKSFQETTSMEKKSGFGGMNLSSQE
jgi:hypothetical protein